MFSSNTPPRNGACDHPQIIGRSVGAAMIRSASPAPRKWFLRTVVPKLLPGRTRFALPRLPRESMVFSSIARFTNPPQIETVSDPSESGELSRKVVGEIAWAMVHHWPALG